MKKYFFLYFFLVLLLPVSSWAGYTTVPCLYGETGTCRQADTCGRADVLAAITATPGTGTGYVNPTSFNGDGVYIPACSATDWTSRITITNKNINIIGGIGGTTNINLTGTGGLFLFTISSATRAQFRISGLTISNQVASVEMIQLNTAGVGASSYGWRIDHIVFTSTLNNKLLLIYGPTWGLMDHLTVTASYGNNLIADYISGEPTGNGYGYYSLLLPMDYGTNKAVYCEDSTFDFTGAGDVGAYVFDASSGGMRLVFRHNTVTNGRLYSHWTRNYEIDGHKYEIYNNNFDGSAYGGSGGYPMRLESGTGLIYNNTFKNYDINNAIVDERRGCGSETFGTFGECEGSKAWDGNAGDPDAPGWPCLGQIGRGTGGTARGDQPSVPMMLWNNGTEDGCSTGGTCTNSTGIGFNTTGCTRDQTKYIRSTPHPNGDVDYWVGTSQPTGAVGNYTLSYTPLAYPHPLQGALASSITGGVLTGGTIY